MANIKTATAITPVTLQTQLATSETPLYSAATGIAYKSTTASVTNTTGSSATYSISVVKSGGTAGAANRIAYNVALAAGATNTIALGVLNEGDFVSAISNTASAITFSMSGFEFSTASTGGSGIFVDSFGVRNGANNVNTMTTTIQVGVSANRYLVVPWFFSNHGGNWGAWSSFPTLTVTSNLDGALTRLSSADYGTSGQRTASVHFFGRANPTNGLHTLTYTVTAAGGAFKFDMQSKPICYGGVASSNGATFYSSGGSSQTLNLPVTSAAGNVPLCATISSNSFYGLDQNVRDFDSQYNTDLLLEAPGAATATFTSANALVHGAVGINLVSA